MEVNSRVTDSRSAFHLTLAPFHQPSGPSGRWPCEAPPHSGLGAKQGRDASRSMRWKDEDEVSSGLTATRLPNPYPNLNLSGEAGAADRS